MCGVHFNDFCCSNCTSGILGIYFVKKEHRSQVLSYIAMLEMISKLVSKGVAITGEWRPAAKDFYPFEEVTLYVVLHEPVMSLDLNSRL